MNGILRHKSSYLLTGVFVAIGALVLDAPVHATSRLPNIPKNEVALNTSNLCRGASRALQNFQSDFGTLLAFICSSDGQATPLLESLVANPHQGQGPISVTSVGLPVNGQNVDLIFAVALAFDGLNPVDALVGEEKHAIRSYQSASSDEDGLSMQFAFLPPEKNTGECDTKFKISQNVSITGPGAEGLGNDGKDTSIHELRLFRMYPDNFDFFISGRSLVKPTPLFAKSSVIRAFMPWPSDPRKTISVSILHFNVKNLGSEERTKNTFEKFIVSNLAELYATQSARKE